VNRILYIRHGESEANVAGVFAGGAEDSLLTARGRAQAKQAAEKLQDIHIDTIIASSLRRTLETAQIIAAGIGYDARNIATDERLKEYNVGAAQGEPLRGMTAQKLIHFPGAEDPQDFAKRVTAVLQEIKAMPGTILVVAHGGVSRLIECLKEGKDPENFYDMPKQNNAEILELDLSWLSEST